MSISAVTVATSFAVGSLGDGVDVETGQPVLLAPLNARSVIYDANGDEMALLFAEEDRQLVSLEAVPHQVVETIIAVEDADFYEHDGVNVRATMRALIRDVQAGGIEEGGSTITQQLIKNSVTGSDQTLERKVNEVVLARRLDDQMSKDEILERYLNTVYLGHGAYGVQAGAETYFGTDVENLSWEEAALIAALIRNPVGYDPISHPELARERREIVAARLLATDTVSELVYDRIIAAPMPTMVFERRQATESAQLVGGNYFAEEVKQELLDHPELGDTDGERYDAVFKGGLRVYTTYDPQLQQKAEAATAELPDTDGEFFAGLASIEPSTGAIRAMVGGPDFDEQQANVVTQGWRQPGSSYKTLVLLAALEAGYVPSDTISGSSPCRFEDPSAEDGVYEAENSGGSRGRTTTIKSQTASSSNCAYLRLGQTVGLDRVAELSEALGITSIDENFSEVSLTEDPPISMPIGTREVHPLAMAGAYAAIANDGVYHEPYYIDRITDAAGNVLYEHADAGRRVFSVQTARLATEVLEYNVVSGTGTRARLDEQPVAGKTGTTQNNWDAWFVGFSPSLATAVWIGNPVENTQIVIGGSRTQGGGYPAIIWGEYMAAVHDGLPVIEFEPPEDTRRGRSIRYRNPVDRGRSTRSTSSRRSPTTTAPPDEGEVADAGDGEGDGGDETPTEDTSPPATTVEPTTPPATSPPVTEPPPPPDDGG